jgi:RNA-directed DNA polymerase
LKYKNNANNHPWFKRKGYLHFDFSLERDEAEKYVANPDNIQRHRFSPLIHYEKITRKVQRNKEKEKTYKESGIEEDKPHLDIKEKPRNIFYASHIDGYIYSYYSHKIQKSYNDFLCLNNLDSNVIAYRPIEKNGDKLSNIHFAKEIFDFIKQTRECYIFCFDISKFFDRLSVDILKKKWSQVLGAETLPNDHFTVYKSLAHFCYVEEGHLKNAFKARFNQNPRQHGLVGEYGGSSKNRICDYSELRELERSLSLRGKKLIKKKSCLGITGIPQGTAISGLLSNIFMIDFDISVKGIIEGLNGCYRRYSDDIFIAVPLCSINHYNEIESVIKDELEKTCTNSIQINKKKTDIKIYKQIDNKSFLLDTEGKPSFVQYLGFNFDGSRIFIRNSSISRDRGNIVKITRKNKKRDHKINTVEVFKSRSPRQITPYDNRKLKGFTYYAQRAENILDQSSTINNQVNKNDSFIKRTIEKERFRKPTNIYND